MFGSIDDDDDGEPLGKLAAAERSESADCFPSARVVRVGSARIISILVFLFLFDRERVWLPATKTTW